MLRSTLLLLAVPLTELCAQQVPVDTSLAPLFRSIDSAALARFKTQQFSGIILIARAGRGTPPGGVRLFERTFGMADHAQISASTEFITGSIAQTFVAVAIAQMVERGAIALDSAVSRYLPDSVVSQVKFRRITIRQLLTHSTGGAFHDAEADYTLLGKVIERVNGERVATYMRDRVFIPAGMKHSGFDGSGAVASSTAADLTSFADALFRGRLLSRMTTSLWSSALPTGQLDASAGFGFGFFVGSTGNARIVSQGGTGLGINNVFDIYPDLGYVVVVLANRDPAATQDIRRLSRTAIGALPSPS